jgi:hypothetical protein
MTSSEPEHKPANSSARAGTQRTCPSTFCHEGARLLGVMTPAGTLAYIQPPTKVSADFVERAQALGHPERRFRFSGPCIEGACPQWNGSGCGVVDIAIEQTPPRSSAEAPALASLPACGIRHSCRWYAQRGAAACQICPMIVADTGGTMTYQSAHRDALTPDK